MRFAVPTCAVSHLPTLCSCMPVPLVLWGSYMHCSSCCVLLPPLLPCILLMPMSFFGLFTYTLPFLPVPYLHLSRTNLCCAEPIPAFCLVSTTLPFCSLYVQPAFLGMPGFIYLLCLLHCCFYTGASEDLLCTSVPFFTFHACSAFPSLFIARNICRDMPLLPALSCYAGVPMGFLVSAPLPPVVFLLFCCGFNVPYSQLPRWRATRSVHSGRWFCHLLCPHLTLLNTYILLRVPFSGCSHASLGSFFSTNNTSLSIPPYSIHFLLPSFISVTWAFTATIQCTYMIFASSGTRFLQDARGSVPLALQPLFILYDMTFLHATFFRISVRLRLISLTFAPLRFTSRTIPAAGATLLPGRCCLLLCRRCRGAAGPPLSAAFYFVKMALLAFVTLSFFACSLERVSPLPVSGCAGTWHGWARDCTLTFACLLFCCFWPDPLLSARFVWCARATLRFACCCSIFFCKLAACTRCAG